MSYLLEKQDYYKSDMVFKDFSCSFFTDYMPFNLGCAFKYIWRAGKKDKKTFLKDMEKARDYIKGEYSCMTGNMGTPLRLKNPSPVEIQTASIFQKILLKSSSESGKKEAGFRIWLLLEILEFWANPSKNEMDELLRGIDEYVEKYKGDY